MTKVTLPSNGVLNTSYSFLMMPDRAAARDRKYRR